MTLSQQLPARASAPLRPATDALLAERYGSGAPAGFSGSNALIDGILGHRSIRKYRDQAVPESLLVTLLAAAQSAATSSNLQLWSVVTVDEPSRRRALAAASGGQAHVQEAPRFLAWIADLHRLARIAATRGASGPALDSLELFLTASIDASLAAQTFVVAAESLGLGTVYIGGLRNDPVRVAEILELPPRTFAVFGMCLGWPDPAVPTAVKPRLPQELVLHRERYRSVEERAHLLDRYDRDTERYQRGQRAANPIPWTEQSTARIARGGLTGAPTLRDALAARGLGSE